MSTQLDFLTGAWDIHVHASPCIHPRKMDAMTLAREAEKCGMAGLVLKSHHGSTSELAVIINGIRTSLNVYGGVTLNRTVGGLNPFAVEASFLVGGKLVWLPTKDGSGHKEISKDLNAKSISILNDQGKVNDDTKEIIDLVNQNNGVLASGHIGKKEIFTLHKYLRKSYKGVNFLINHSLFLTPNLESSDIRSLTHENTYFETCFLTMSDIFSFKKEYEVASIIKDNLQSNWILATDSGQVNNQDPTNALSSFISCLINEGVEENKILQFSSYNPKKLIEGSDV